MMKPICAMIREKRECLCPGEQDMLPGLWIRQKARLLSYLLEVVTASFCRRMSCIRVNISIQNGVRVVRQDAVLIEPIAAGLMATPLKTGFYVLLYHICEDSKEKN